MERPSGVICVSTANPDGRQRRDGRNFSSYRRDLFVQIDLMFAIFLGRFSQQQTPVEVLPAVHRLSIVTVCNFDPCLSVIGNLDAIFRDEYKVPGFCRIWSFGERENDAIDGSRLG